MVKGNSFRIKFLNNAKNYYSPQHLNINYTSVPLYLLQAVSK